MGPSEAPAKKQPGTLVNFIHSVEFVGYFLGSILSSWCLLPYMWILDVVIPFLQLLDSYL